MWGNLIYDEFVRPVERVVDFRTRISGIRPRDLRKGQYYLCLCFFLNFYTFECTACAVGHFQVPN